MLQPTIKEEQGEEATDEVAVTEEVAAAGKPAVEVVVDEDATMQDALAVALVAEAVWSAEATRMTPRDAMEELLGIWSDRMIHGYLEPSLVEIAWHNYQETCKLHKSSDWRERLNRMIIHRLDILVAQAHTRNTASMQGKGKWKAEECKRV